MATQNEVFERTVALVSEILSVPASKLTGTTRIVEDLEADSMDVVSLAIAVDDAFDVEMDLADIPEANVTINWIAEYIGARSK